MNLFDTHAHLNDPSLQSMGSELFEAAQRAGVQQIVAIGTDLNSSLQCLEIAHANEGVYVAVGIHPNSCHQADDQQWRQIESLIEDEKVVAIGETGLDCYWDDCPLPVQQEWFARHIELSHQSGLPLVVHQRDSEKQILDSFARHNQHGRINGIMHSCTGTWESVNVCLEYGMYISFAGMVTFKNAQAVREVAVQVPDDRILIETDSPYLTPHPHRGKRPNQPAMVAHTAECLAELRQTELAAFAELTTENANRVFKIKKTLHENVEFK